MESDLARFAEATGEGASLSLRRGDEVLNVNVVPPSSGFGQIIPANSAWPLTATWSAQVRVHLAYADDETRARALAVPAIRYTDKTVTGRGELKTLLEMTRQEGIAYSVRGKGQRSRRCSCARLLHHTLVAALGLHLPPERFDEDHLDRYVPQLRAAAEAMGERLEETSTLSRPRAGRHRSLQGATRTGLL